MRPQQGFQLPASLPGPSPKPSWFWTWADWRRRGHCPPRPSGLPRLIPVWAWRALVQFNRQYPAPKPKPCAPVPPLKPKPQYRREKALAEAKKWLGTKERTSHNDVLFSDWYGLHAPWCAMFVTWCYDHAGSKSFAPGLNSPIHPGSGTYAYVPYIVHDARNDVNGLSTVAIPRAGDIVCYDWDGGVADHTGLFVEWVGNDSFRAIEGNTGIGNDSNGGEVMYRIRRRSQVQAFVRVNK